MQQEGEDDPADQQLENKQAARVESVVDQVEQNFRQPLVVEPRMVRSGVGKRVGCREGLE